MKVPEAGIMTLWFKEWQGGQCAGQSKRGQEQKEGDEVRENIMKSLFEP